MQSIPVNYTVITVNTTLWTHWYMEKNMHTKHTDVQRERDREREKSEWFTDKALFCLRERERDFKIFPTNLCQTYTSMCMHINEVLSNLMLLFHPHIIGSSNTKA
eukprot:TRINITY_DN86345_c0_g1_i2.p1 TRINITY_DN86345_c0_g1~~TRINITY_DN86345_c0_g1_i2.p1  ORF type:complete len:105 (+),score=8.06 TRINITY_DN86345_c0_g1_i2:43-357(+)